MDALSAAGALITLAALFSWLNHRYIRQPVSVAMLLFSLALSLVLVALGKLGVDSTWLAREAIGAIELDRALRWPRSASMAAAASNTGLITRPLPGAFCS